MDKLSHSRGFSPSSHPSMPRASRSKEEQALDIASMLEQDASEAGTRGYVSRVFTQVSLPYRDPLKSNPDATVWQRRNGGMTLFLEPSMSVGVDGVYRRFPFGKYPRLILPWVTTQILLADRRQELDLAKPFELSLGDSLRSFLADLGHSWGGRSGAIVRNQVESLFGSRFTVHEMRQLGGGTAVRHASFQVATAYQLWWNDREGLDDEQPALWGNSVVLSPDFVKDVLTTPIPLDLRALAILSKSGPLAMDIYSWLNYRLPNMGNRSSIVTWEQLNWQFGSQYDRIRAFKAQFLKQLGPVRAAYPHADFAVLEQGLRIARSAPAVRRRDIDLNSL